MSERPFRDAASATTYHGFSTAPPRPGGEPTESAQTGRRSVLPVALVAVAASAALAWAVTGGPKDHQLSAANVAPRAMPIAAPVLAPAPPPLAPAPRLAVEPVPEARSAIRASTVAAPAAHSPRRPVRPAPQRHVATAPEGPAFHCDWRLRRSERMVCNDAQLARLDRELNHAYGAAVAAGADRAALRRAQDAWVFRREAVARRGQGALAQDYRRRIAQLEALTERPRHARRRR